jgi:GTP-binding protein HflX
LRSLIISRRVLVRGWTHLERQKGGIGLRGPGETQLETDRRLLGKRVKLLKERLHKLERQRGVQRKARTRGDVLNVSLGWVHECR